MKNQVIIVLFIIWFSISFFAQKSGKLETIYNFLLTDSFEQATHYLKNCSFEGIRNQDWIIISDNLIGKNKIVSAKLLLEQLYLKNPFYSPFALRLATVYRSLKLHSKEKKILQTFFTEMDNKKLNKFIKENSNTLLKTSEAVIQKYLQAIGGADKLRNIKTLIVTSRKLNAINEESRIL